MKKFSLLPAILPCGCLWESNATQGTSAQRQSSLLQPAMCHHLTTKTRAIWQASILKFTKAVDEKLSDYEIQFQKNCLESIFPGLDSGHYRLQQITQVTKNVLKNTSTHFPFKQSPRRQQQENTLTSLDQIAGGNTGGILRNRTLGSCWNRNTRPALLPSIFWRGYW